MGDGVGPCGQCTEKFYAHDPYYYIYDDLLEMWNTVFTEYRAEGSSLVPLTHYYVDTRMGVYSNFDTDVFYSMKYNLLFPPITSRVNLSPYTTLLNILSDHFRTVSALIYQGIYLSPTCRGYILRKLIRRCLKYEYIYNIQFPFLSSCIPAVIQSLELFYPDISSHVQDITSIMENEEMYFWRAFECGKDKLEDIVKSLKKRSIPPSLVDLNQLYGSTGISLDLSLNTNISEDEIGQSKAKDNKSKRTNIGLDSYVIPTLSVLPSFHTFNGYTIHYNNNNNNNLPPLLSTQSTSSIQAILNPPRGNKAKYSYVCIDPCPFFPMGGGQLGDQGTLLTDDGNTIPIIDTIRVNEHFILLKTSISVPKSLLHAHLINPLSPKFPLTSPLQAGSHVDPSIMRLDYSFKGDQNSLSQNTNSVHYDYMSYTDSISRGYTGIFADNYKETVRGVEVEGIRTHCENIKDIYPFITLKNSSISAGITRVEAVTGPKAVDYLYNEHISLKHCVRSINKFMMKYIMKSIQPTTSYICNNKEIHYYICYIG
ncbi:hypothetical protein WA158_003528 [Blastocystis sp. Blastoise]